MSVLREGVDREEHGEAPPPVLQGVGSRGGARPRPAVSGRSFFNYVNRTPIFTPQVWLVESGSCVIATPFLLGKSGSWSPARASNRSFSAS